MYKALIMKNKYLFVVLISICTTSLFAQVNVWQSAELPDITHRDAEERWTSPTNFNLMKMDVELLRAELASAPHEDQLSARNSFASFQFPMPDGSFRTFQVVQYDLMEPKLARRFAHSKAFTGIDAEHGSKIHFNLSKNQFFAVIREKGQTIYIDPYFKHDPTYYMSYNIKNQKDQAYEFSCGTHGLENGEVIEEEIENLDQVQVTDEVFRGKRGGPINLRTYRLAVSGTFRFTTYYGGTVQGAIDGMATIVNRINSVLERDAAIRLVLVNDNDKIIFLTQADCPFYDDEQNGELGPIIGQNQITIDQRVGSTNYDIGHVFGNAFYQGLAQLGAVCGGSKARGASVSSPPFGDGFTVSIICHEMGHQFSANHTMYHCHNVNTSTAYEIGSGSTIMSYAGICSGTNVIGGADDYYHANSLEAIIGFSRNGGGAGCGVETDFGNTDPDITLGYPNKSYIPVNTAFRLTGQATDAENSNSLTYIWEQYQAGSRDWSASTWDLTQPIGNEPLFRSIPPSPDPTRYFPSLPRILSGTNYRFEQLPTYARDLRFRFIVRDNAAENGATVWSSMNIEVIDNSAAGQFELTNWNTKDTAETGSAVELTWNVAETDLAPINTQFVDIYMSVDSGQSFPMLIKEHTPNDGATVVNIPNTPTARFLFMIKANNSVYLDVSNRSSVIKEVSKPTLGLDYDDQYYQICAPDLVEFPITPFGMGGFDDNVHFDFVGSIPNGGIVSFTKSDVTVGSSTALRLDLREITEDGEYDLTVMASASGVDTVWRTIEVRVVNNNFDDLNLVFPADGSTGNDFVPTLSWDPVPNADNYTLEVSDEPSFNNIIFSRVNLTVDEIQLDVQLDAGGVYFWRVKPNNACGSQDLNNISAFQVKSLSCEEFCSTEPSRLISQSGMPTVEMSINTGASITVNDLNVTQILGQHQDMGDLIITLEGPDGTKVDMMESGTCDFVNAFLIDMGFDDDAAIENPNCQNFGEGIRFVPDNPLDTMNGISGTTYKLIIQDIESGAGGRLDSWCFEICGDIAPEKPLLVKADSIHLPQLSNRVVSADKLEVTHSQYGPEELTITVVEVPAWGTMLFDGIAVGTGTQLTMQDVIDNKLAYLNQSRFYDHDEFSFIVTDPGGGFLGTPTIEFVIGLVATKNELPAGSEFTIFPNPTSNIINLQLASNELQIDRVDLFSMQGKRLKSITNSNNTNQLTMDMSSYSTGIYFIQVRSGQYTVVRKIVKQ